MTITDELLKLAADGYTNELVNGDIVSMALELQALRAVASVATVNRNGAILPSPGYERSLAPGTNLFVRPQALSEDDMASAARGTGHCSYEGSFEIARAIIAL